MRTSLCGIRRSVLGVGGAALLAVASLTPASAHVTLDADTTAAGAYTLLTVGFSHGCDGSATTKVSISVPEEITTIKPGMNYGWTVEKVTDDTASPVAGGHDAAGRVSEIIYTAKEPVEDGFYDQFLLSVQLPEDAEGETLYFPTIQTCEQGETAWVQIPEEGEDGDDLDAPAPSVTVTAPEEEEHGLSSGSHEG